MEHLLEADVAIVGHLGRCTHRPFLGRDENDTVGTTATVDGCGRCIFQDVHRLDVRGVDVRQLPHEGDSIQHDKRVVACRQGALSTDADLHFSTGLRACLRHQDTSHTTLQGLGCVGGSDLVEFFTVHISHRASDSLATLGTVTDDHHLVEVAAGRF